MWKTMELKAFETLKKAFRDADVDAKINMYVSAEDLTQLQYKELLHLFPLNQLYLLEEALS